jgi:hypothetical protein
MASDLVARRLFAPHLPAGVVAGVLGAALLYPLTRANPIGGGG